MGIFKGIRTKNGAFVTYNDSPLELRLNPKDCKVFGTACKPSSPLWSCMVSSEGACSAYFKYGGL